MTCLHCHGTRTTPLQRTTDLGYVVFRCIGCDRIFKERTGTPFNFLGAHRHRVSSALLSAAL